MRIFLQVNQNSGEADASWQWGSPWGSGESGCFSYQVYHDYCAKSCNLRILQPLGLPQHLDFESSTIMSTVCRSLLKLSQLVEGWVGYSWLMLLWLQLFPVYSKCIPVVCVPTSLWWDCKPGATWRSIRVPAIENITIWFITITILLFDLSMS